MNEWINLCQETDFTNYAGFLYRITNLVSGKLYLGKKSFSSKPKWENYWGSCEPLKIDIKKLGNENFKREIILLCPTHSYLNYAETRLLFQENVLEAWHNGDYKYYNSCILGKYFRGKL